MARRVHLPRLMLACCPRPALAVVVALAACAPADGRPAAPFGGLCASAGAPVALAGTDLLLDCADLGAAVDRTSNFTGLVRFLEASMPGGSFGWQLDERAGPETAWLAPRAGAFDYGEDDVDHFRFTGTTSDGDAVVLTLAAATSADGLRCARLAFHTVAYDLACYATNVPTRGLCNRYGFPADGPLAPTRTFVLAFSPIAESPRVDAVLAQVQATPGVAGVTSLSPGRIYRVGFDGSVAWDAVRAAVLGWCPSAPDLAVTPLP